jgi:hypothetical protein
VNLCRFLIFVYIYIVFGEPIIKMGNAKIPLNDLTPPYFYASPKSGPGFQMPYLDNWLSKDNIDINKN